VSINPCFKTRSIFALVFGGQALIISVLHASAADSPAPKLTISQASDGPQVFVDGKLFTQYLTSSGARPVLWPVNGPTGAPMTRSYSVGPAEPGEETDHPHHRSIWFGYEGLNGVDYWHGGEFGGRRTFPAGSVRHREFLRTDSDGHTATIFARNDYLDELGERVAVDERQLKFGADTNSRWIDCIIVLKSPGRPLVIGDTKEGAFALRVSEKLRSDRNPASVIVTSRGDRNDAAWGKPAEWVDYSGEIDGEAVGIAMLTHPSSHQAAPRWHVRPYGLFAANPFGAKDYSGGAVEGGLTVPADKAVVLRHKIVFHRGNCETAKVQSMYEEYAKQE
jgi:hypothetical protein